MRLRDLREIVARLNHKPTSKVAFDNDSLDRIRELEEEITRLQNIHEAEINKINELQFENTSLRAIEKSQDG